MYEYVTAFLAMLAGGDFPRDPKDLRVARKNKRQKKKAPHIQETEAEKTATENVSSPRKLDEYLPNNLVDLENMIRNIDGLYQTLKPPGNADIEAHPELIVLAEIRQIAVDKFAKVRLESKERGVDKELRFYGQFTRTLREFIAKTIMERCRDEPSDVQNICEKLARAIKINRFEGVFTREELSSELFRTVTAYTISEIAEFSTELEEFYSGEYEVHEPFALLYLLLSDICSGLGMPTDDISWLIN